MRSADSLSDAKLQEVLRRQRARMIIYDREGDFTSEIIPAKYLREDALLKIPFSDGE